MTHHHFSNRATESCCSQVRHIIYDESVKSEFDFFFVIDEISIQQMLRPQKESLLYSFSVNVIFFSYDYVLKKVPEPSDFTEIMKDFESYGISIPPYDEPSHRDFGASSEWDLDRETLFELREAQEQYFYKYVDDLRDGYCLELSKAIAKEVMEYLFIDRNLMRVFNERVARYVNQLDKKAYPELFNQRGNVNRFSGNWPKWLRSALIYREQGKCAIKGEDLTALLANDIQPNIDHIVPLALGGTNDTSNLQYVCRQCNLDKLDHTVETTNRRKTLFF